MGALQSVAHVPSLPGWNNLSWFNKFKIQVLIRLRVYTYAIGFPISTISLTTWLGFVMADLIMTIAGYPLGVSWSWLMVPGFTMWVGATQLGLSQNLRYVEFTKWQKFEEHIRVLILTPVAGLFDTAGPMMAVIKWTLGRRSVNWIPTPKISDKAAEVVL